jgi:hypothetical protein
MRRGGQTVYADSEAWRILNGRVPADFILVRSDACDDPACCNPDHRCLMSRGRFARFLVNSGRASLGIQHRLFTESANRRRAKLTLQKARALRRAARAGKSIEELAAHFGIHPNTVRRVLLNLTWREPSAWAI